MSESTTAQTVAKYKCLIVNILALAKHTKPKLYELISEFNNLWSSPEFTKLPEYAKDALYDFANTKRHTMISENTILLWDHQGVLKTKPTGGASAYYWLDVVEKCDDYGIITITKTPTDKIYLFKRH